ncbi:MAG TPA: hypothetical protein VKD71_00915 [Gemmataceae bacterium]|nr:hypothetical protein [Gemmataceae bacterium]
MSFRHHLVRWEAEFKACGLVVVEVSGGECIEFDRSRQRLEKWNVHHPVLWDRDNKNIKAFAISGWPSAYLIGADGRVFWQGNPATLPSRQDDEEAFRRALVAQIAKVTLSK